jgi:HEPN domain-containing protein
MVNNNQEAGKWLKKAEQDIDTAQYNLIGSKFEAAAFFAQQSAEKALKALFILKHKRLWKNHDLVMLGEKVGAPKQILKICDKINPHYIVTRYPIEAEYRTEDVETVVKNSKKILKWAKSQLK